MTVETMTKIYESWRSNKSMVEAQVIVVNALLDEASDQIYRQRISNNRAVKTIYKRQKDKWALFVERNKLNNMDLFDSIIASKLPQIRKLIYENNLPVP